MRPHHVTYFISTGLLWLFLTLATNTVYAVNENDYYGYQAVSIVLLYAVAFHREPDITGLNYWALESRKGMDRREIAFHFYYSTEFQEIFGGTSNREFVTRIYQQGLNRDGDEAGIAYWLERLENGDSRGQLLLEFSDSYENRNNNAELIYRLYMTASGEWDFEPPPQPLPTPIEVEQQVSIDQGIYGLITTYNDVGSYNPILVLPGFTVNVFYEKPSSGEEAIPLLSTESDSRGIYQIPLQSDEYCVCTAFRRCTSITVSENKTLRLDYTFSNGPGWSLFSKPAQTQSCVEL